MIDNKPGAGTVLGVEYVAKALPDGYTLVLTAASSFSINPVLIEKLPYHPINSFDPIGIVGSTGLVLLANSVNIKSNTIHDLIDEIKSHSKAQDTNQYNSYASFGAGTTSHFAGEMINFATGMSLLHIPYKGSSPAMNDLIGGQVNLSVDTVVAAAPQIRSGKIKGIMVTSSKRSDLLPEIPTALESGYPTVQLSTWFAVLGPKGLPTNIRQKLEAAVLAVMSDPATKKALLSNGFEPEYGSPQEYRNRVTEEIIQLTKTAKQSKIVLGQ